MGIPLTPLASLCLGVVRGWINVARRGRGGQIDESGTAWTRLPAEQLRDQLEREFLVEVSTRSVQRALKELEEAKQIRREQRWKHRYKRDYWYAIPEQEEALEALRPRTIAGNYQSQRSRPANRIEPTRASGQVLVPPTTNTHLLKPKTENQHPQRRNTISAAIDACMSKGKHPQRPSAPQQKRPAPQGFGTAKSTGPIQGGNNGNPAGMDQHGRPLREVWVGGRAHLVVD